MGFSRAKWHSGLTYRQTCQTCNSIVEYTDHKLDFRPWYPDGYIDCPRCKTHLRHNESFAINRPDDPALYSVGEKGTTVSVPVEHVESTAPKAIFCTTCGRKFDDSDRFCASCGSKRD